MTHHARGMLVRLLTAVLAVAGVGLMPLMTTTAQAAPGDVGYADYQYGPPTPPDPTTGIIDPDLAPTASKPQSKLWFAQGTWWGVLQVPNTTTTTIHAYNTSTHQWADTGVIVDNRLVPTQADVLWDGASGKLYVASAGRNGTSSGIRVMRFRYDAATGAWVTDPGLPTGAINGGGVEAAVIAKDSTGRLWVAYTADAAATTTTPAGRNVRVLVSNTAQTSWSAPTALPVDGTFVARDDIATLIAHDGMVSVVWSNQNADAAGNTAIYVAQHPDSALPTDGWSASQRIFNGPKAADDHLSLTSAEGAPSGTVFAVIKTAADDQAVDTGAGLVRLLVLRPTGVWETYVHSTVADDMTRPIILLEPAKNLLHVLATAPVAGGVVYEKTSPMDKVAFAGGRGNPFIKLAAHNFVNNATSTKQNVTAASGMLVLASDQKTGYYVHNYVPGVAVTKPAASFTYTPASGSAPLAVTFTDTSTGAPTSWAWDFGDGGKSTAQNPTYTYTKPGSYTVTLTASNAAGTSTKTATVTVTVAKPVAGFTYTPASGPAPLAVKFTDTSTGAPTSWAWDFGDGGKSTAQNPSYTYTKAGTYTVTLTASNAGGTSTPKTATVTVTAPAPAPPTKPVAGFTSTPTSGPAPLAVKFTDTSSGAPTKWAWTFGDGGTSTLQHPSHTFAKAGAYTVTLTASNAAGSSTKTATITVTAVATPPAGPPVVELDKPDTTFAQGPYVDAAWHTTTDPAAVGSYDVWVRQIGPGRRSKWSDGYVNHHQGTSVRLPARPGYTYCLRVRGTTLGGTTGEWSAGRCTAVPLDDRSMTRHGAWRKVADGAYFMGTAMMTRARGASLVRKVTGTKVYLLVTRRPGGGKVRVYQGHRLVKKVSLRAGSTRAGRVRIASHAKVTTARYRIVVVSARKPVVIDGIAASRE